MQSGSSSDDVHISPIVRKISLSTKETQICYELSNFKSEYTPLVNRRKVDVTVNSNLRIN